MGKKITRTKEQGTDDRKSGGSLVTRLLSELSGTAIEAETSDGPVCKRCDELGTASDDLSIAAGGTVYAVACWGEWTGWQLFGVYHAAHAESLRSLSESSSKPTVTFKGRIERTSGGPDRDTDPDTYVLTDLSFVDLAFPEDLVFPEELAFPDER